MGVGTKGMSMDMGSRFEVRRDDLCEVMRLSGPKARTEIAHKYGGTTQLCAKLQTDPIDGLRDDIKRREDVFGRNVIPMKKPKTFLQLVWNALKEPTLIILEGAAAVSLAVSLWGIYGRPNRSAILEGSRNQTLMLNDTYGAASLNDTDTDPTPFSADSADESDSQYEWIESVAIIIAVILVVLVSAINDYGKEKQFQALQNQVRLEQKVTVVRNGEQRIISNEDLVVGDICMLKYGDIVPADGLVLSSHDLSVDESSLTGESDHVKKHPDTDIRLLSGTHIMEGTGKILIVAVGIYSQTGIIYSLLGAADKKDDAKKKDKKESKDESSDKNDQVDEENTKQKAGDDEEQSVLQKKLTLIATQIGKVGLFFGVATSLILIIRFCVQKYAIDQRPWDQSDDVYKILNAVIIGITILVVAIPEGLPLAVTLTLAVSAKKMMKDHNLVRNLFACETMGCATTICSDKTGTLTTNRMTVTESFLGGKSHSPYPSPETVVPALLDLTAEGVAVNSNYTTNVNVSSSAAGALPVQLGNKTECALLHFLQGIGYDYRHVRAENPEDSFVKVYTFNSNRKSMSTVISIDRGWRVHCKGAAEIILAKCDFLMKSDGTVERMTDGAKADILDTVVSRMASNGLRTICVAYKDFIATSGVVAEHELASPNEPSFDQEEQILSGLTCLAIFGIEDPVRPEVPAAIVKCRKAGVTVRMLTGDNVNTARSIAAKCGIIVPDDLNSQNVILEGDEFNRRIRNERGEVDQVKFDAVWPKLRVLARSTPQDKYALVEGIIKSRATKHREVVAVTGDGTNDAPALKKADVGFAMGIAGTEVAKEASDIIITDDNFISIVQACMWGRNIYDNICKFLQFQLTVNVTALITSIIGAAVLQEAPLKAVPMLWINLIQDTLASLALATEPPSDHLLNRKPYGRKANLLSRIMIRNIIGQGFYQLVILFFLLFGQRVFNINPEYGLAAFHGYELETNKQLDTIIFNAFVFMTIFNLVNSRCIHNERNVFARFLRNPFFIVIFMLMLGTQVIVVQFGGNAFKTVGLTWQQWVMCIAFGVGSLLWYQVLCFIPTKKIKDKMKKKLKAGTKNSYKLSSV